MLGSRNVCISDVAALQLIRSWWSRIEALGERRQLVRIQSEQLVHLERRGGRPTVRCVPFLARLPPPSVPSQVLGAAVGSDVSTGPFMSVMLMVCGHMMRRP